MVKSIACLPIAGIENPYQFLTMESLSQEGFKVFHGSPGKVFPLTRSCMMRPTFIHVDWIHQYYLRRIWVFTQVQMFLFILDVLIARSIFQIPIVWTIHNIYPHDKKPTVFSWGIRTLFAASCTKIRVLNASTASKVQKEFNIPQGKICIHPEGSYVGYYDDSLSKLDALSTLNLSKTSKFRLLFFGSIRPYKGVDVLLEKWEQLDCSNLELIIAGKCNDLDYLSKIQKLIESRNTRSQGKIHLFNELVPDNMVQAYFKVADVVVLPFQIIENSGSVKLAMSFGKPIITKATSTLESLLAYQSELLYSSEDEISSTITKAQNMDDVKLTNLGRSAQAKASSLSWKGFGNVFNNLT